MRRGFSFVELLLVIAIVAILTGLPAPFFGRFLTQNAVSNSADYLAASLRKAQFYAMTSRKSNSSGWGVRYESNAITLYQGASYAARNTIWDETYTVNNNITITGISEVNFSRGSGIPSTALTVTISGTGNTKTVSLNSQGGISL